jgi:hypothetical protein
LENPHLSGILLIRIFYITVKARFRLKQGILSICRRRIVRVAGIWQFRNYPA